MSATLHMHEVDLALLADKLARAKERRMEYAARPDDEDDESHDHDDAGPGPLFDAPSNRELFGLGGRS